MHTFTELASHSEKCMYIILSSITILMTFYNMLREEFHITGLNINDDIINSVIACKLFEWGICETGTTNNKNFISCTVRIKQYCFKLRYNSVAIL